MTAMVLGWLSNLRCSWCWKTMRVCMNDYVPDKHHKKHVSNPPKSWKLKAKPKSFTTRLEIFNIPESKPNPTQQKLKYAFLHPVAGRSDVNGSLRALVFPLPRLAQHIPYTQWLWIALCKAICSPKRRRCSSIPFSWLLGRRWVSVRHENMSNIHGTLQKQYQNEQRHRRSDEQAYSFLVTCSTLPVVFCCQQSFVLDVAPRRSSSLFHGHQLNRPEEYPKHRRRDTAKGWWGARN